MSIRFEEKYHDVIEKATGDFGDHVGITRSKIIRWLRQVSSRRRALAAKVLASIVYFADSNINTMARQLVQVAYAEYSGLDKNRICFVPIGGAGSGAQQIARHLRSMRDVPRRCVIDLLELTRRPSEEVSVVVFFDDFSGTGETIVDWWDLNEPIIRPKNTDIVLGVLVLNGGARRRLQDLLGTVMSVEELPDSANVFHADCAGFTAAEKATLLRLCKRTGCGATFLKGWGECGLLLAFKHGCPNNSLPILWYEKEERWEPLFKRRGT